MIQKIIEHPSGREIKKSSELEKEKHEQWRIFLLDFKNIIGYGGRAATPPERDDDSDSLNLFFERCINYPYLTVEQQYSKDNYDKSILPQLLKYCPEEVTDLNKFVNQLNEAVKARDVEKVRNLLKQSSVYINSFAGVKK